MACPTCGLTVLFGGVRDGDKKYCSKKCYEADEINRVAKEIPYDKAMAMAQQIRNGRCPQCGGYGPIDLHQSYSIYSIFVFTSYKTKEHMACKACGKKQQLSDLMKSFFFGWWGIPHGLIITPIQIIKNILAMSKNSGKSAPTELLIQRIRQKLAAEQMRVKT